MRKTDPQGPVKKPRSRLIFLVPLALACQWLALNALWYPPVFDSVNISSGYFEVFNSGEAGLALDIFQPRSALPDVGLEPDGALALPPGHALAVERGPRYELVAEGDYMPVVLVGRSVEGRLLEAVTPGIDDDGQPRLLPWSPDKPWAVQRITLKRLENLCGRPLAADQEALSFPRCRLSLPAHADRLAVLAGLDWTVISRPEQPWKRGRKLSRDQIAPSWVLTVFSLSLLAAGLRLPGILTIPPVLLLVSLFSPPLSLVGLLLACVLSLLALLARFLRLAWRHPWRAMAVAGLAVLLLISFVLLIVRRKMPTVPGIVLAGYSNVAGFTLRPGTPGLADHLRANCPQLGKKIRVKARKGQNFQYVQETSCNPKVLPGDHLIFMGGNNDDYFWRPPSESAGESAAFLGTYFQERFSVERSRASFEASNRTEWEKGALAAWSLQEDSLSTTLRCLARKKVPLDYFHHFTLLDLEYPRSPQRSEMLAKRRSLLEKNGARLVSVLDVVHDRASLSWFNDYLHLSSVGHKEVADVICKTLTSDPSPEADTTPEGVSQD